MKKIKKVGLGTVGALALIAAMATPAHADGGPLPGDVVGVGSDTTQYAQNFVGDGDPAGDAGFNSTSANRRQISIDATGDANGRSTTPAGFVVLRAGTAPVARPNGTGGGINFVLNNDLTSPNKVNFMRASGMPSPAQQQQAVTNGWGGLHCYQFGIDGLQMAVSNLVATNAGTVGLSINTLVQLYSATGTVRKWSDVPGYDGPNGGNTIKPFLPQSGSGTLNFFLAQLNAANGSTVTIRSDVGTMEEHDPTLIQNDPDAIAPFSTARLVLINSGYFSNLTANGVKLLAPPTNPNAFATTRPVFVIVRQSSVTDHTGADGIPYPFSGSGTGAKNWVETLYGPAGTPAGSPGGFLARASLARPLVQAAGFTYQYSDAGLCHT
jgi:hypothetical protein